MRLPLAFALIGIHISSAQTTELSLRDINLIPLHDGMNTIEHFAADGRAATIVRAWRDNGNAHGYYLHLVLLPLVKDQGTSNKFGVVAFDKGKDTINDTAIASPFDGERVLGALRFAKATMNGTSTTVMIRADLAEASSGILADHVPADISVYRLESRGVAVGSTPDVFCLVSKTRPPGEFCNADMALATALRLPLPADYAGGKGPSGCNE